ncbi:MAG: cupin domain-containing protein [Proteobacteria bacterium]|uniref:Cupin domain-containing protein n=1 Tax=Candidatus Avisuccinivibrio stercorigallinarum TaxID=2840704 RepID=A0A9D9DCF8_9GAMM|nr:cupin domain-containing protein [Candidatus Avisuccinivibrio stercorigallinarum]
MFGAGAVMAADVPADSQLVQRSADLPAVAGSAEVFTGKVQVQNLSDPLPGMPVTSAYVIFEPGARSFWHTHPVGQTLIIVEGEGRSGVYGEKVSVLRKGDVVVCPKGVKHFHGAAPDQRMVQMTITAFDEQGSNVEWMEEVTDEQYLNTEE